MASLNRAIRDALLGVAELSTAAGEELALSGTVGENG